MFKWTVTGLIKKTETVLKQNNTMDIEEIYFDDMKKTEDAGNAQSLTVKTLAKFKDYSNHRRPVSCISWKCCLEPQVHTIHILSCQCSVLTDRAPGGHLVLQL